ncbi:MAG: hypothetical protein EOM24_36265, partial [Chloroflexia bacterium]|nr:hypothetical protein [Chloroflexia bacterium]
MIRRAKTQLDAAREYERLRETIAFFATVRILPYDAAAVIQFEAFRRQGMRIGTQDLRIASICLTQQATLATRNQRDFGLVPGLSSEDWSLPRAIASYETGHNGVPARAPARGAPTPGPPPGPVGAPLA